ncbi:MULTISPECIES: hypothetical protein, partial [unclassified Microcoleus]|uniref:hypothetical protein n=1 Tax=unclassified Microcoleus TaxID=2642155 RepID=UPI002FD08FFA
TRLLNAAVAKIFGGSLPEKIARCLGFSSLIQSLFLLARQGLSGFSSQSVAIAVKLIPIALNPQNDLMLCGTQLPRTSVKQPEKHF